MKSETEKNFKVAVDNILELAKKYNYECRIFASISGFGETAGDFINKNPKYNKVSEMSKLYGQKTLKGMFAVTLVNTKGCFVQRLYTIDKEDFEDFDKIESRVYEIFYGFTFIVAKANLINSEKEEIND